MFQLINGGVLKLVVLNMHWMANLYQNCMATEIQSGLDSDSYPKKASKITFT